MTRPTAGVLSAFAQPPFLFAIAVCAAGTFVKKRWL